MKKNALFVLAIAGITFVSCKDDEIPTEQNSVNLPAKIYGDSGLVTFKYDNKNRLIEVKQGDSQTAYVLTTFVYNGDNLASAKVQEFAPDNYNSTEDYVFTYQNNQVVAKITYVSSNGSNGTDNDVFTIDGNGRLVNLHGGTALYDTNGNLIKTQTPNEETTYLYDNKNGIFKNVKTPQWAYIYILDEYYTHIVNNAVKIDYKDLDEDQTFSQAISYEYNKDNYPTKMQVAESDYYIKIDYLKK